MILLQHDTCHPQLRPLSDTLFGDSALNRNPTPVTAFNTGLCQCGCSWPPFLSSCQVVKQGLVHELVNAKLIVLSDAGGAFVASFETCASRLMVSEVPSVPYLWLASPVVAPHR
jgi:hypothetical protein